jgi:DNA-binding beta-propeller fold protein YncE
MQRRSVRPILYGTAFTLAAGALLVGQSVLEAKVEAQAQDMVEGPLLEVDPFWPKPLPDHWLLGATIGVWVDDDDLVWIIHRSSATLHDNEKSMELDPPTAICCQGAPPILAFNQAGDLVHAFGGPVEGFEWPESNHGITVDHQGFIWIGGNGANDAHVLKLTKEGEVIMQVGRLGGNAGSNDPNNFGRVAELWVDPETNELYLADGYGNKRVAVLDADTGEMKRFWGAYGNVPDDTPHGPFDPSAPPPQQFRNPVHCVEQASDGLIYVCDRQANRLQVFETDGTFVKEAWFGLETLGSGAVWDIAFSPDDDNRFIYLADGQNKLVRIVDRETLEEIGTFGDGGRQPGQFYGVHSIATDRFGNVYTTETYEGKRVQRFNFQGIGQVPRGDRGVLWPAL